MDDQYGVNNEFEYLQFYKYPRWDSEPSSFSYSSNIYQCCNNPPGTPYFVDSAFKKTIYPQIFLSATAVVFCTIFLFAMLIPFFQQLCDRNTNQQEQTSTPSKFWSALSAAFSIRGLTRPRVSSKKTVTVSALLEQYTRKSSSLNSDTETLQQQQQ